MAKEGFESSSTFYDDKNFPWGFNRCGDFTIAQADILSKYGKTLLALEKKDRSPSTPEEKQFVAVCRGKKHPSTPIEMTWVKYRSLTGNKITVSVFGSSAANAENSGADDYIDDEPLDDD